jgi:hypothetical protein
MQCNAPAGAGSYNLKLHGLAVQLNSADFLREDSQHRRHVSLDKGSTYEVHADGGDVAFCVGIVGESKQQARLSDSRISDEKELEEVVVSIRRVRHLAMGRHPGYSGNNRQPSHQPTAKVGRMSDKNRKPAKMDTSVGRQARPAGARARGTGQAETDIPLRIHGGLKCEVLDWIGEVRPGGR